MMKLVYSVRYLDVPSSWGMHYGFYLFIFFNLFGCVYAICEVLVPWPGIEAALPALEGIVLTIGLPGKSHIVAFKRK